MLAQVNRKKSKRSRHIGDAKSRSSSSSSEAMACSAGGAPRILFLSPVEQFKGGAERVLLDLLHVQGISPVLALPGLGDLSREASRLGIPFELYAAGAILAVHRPLRMRQVWAAIADTLKCARRVHDIARRYQATMIHSNGIKTHVIAGLVRLFYREKVVLHIHDIPYTPIERLIWRLLAWCSDRTVLVSDRCWPGRRIPDKVRVIHNAIEFPAAVPFRAARKPVRLGFVGRFHPQKGLDIAVDWLIAANRAGIPCELVIRGRASAESNDYWQRIQARIASCEFASHVHVEDWCNGGDTVEDVYAGMDVVLFTSQAPEPFGMVILEATRCGIPVIAYPSGSVSLLIKHKETGFLASSPSEFVAALGAMLSEPAMYDQVRCAAFRFCHSKFSLDQHRAQFLALYQGAGGRG